MLLNIYLFLLKDPAATSHLIKKLSYVLTKDQISLFYTTAYHNPVIRLESSCFSFWDSHRYKNLMPTSQGAFLVNLTLRTPDPLLIGHLLLYSLDMAGTGRRSLEFHGIGHMDTVETEILKSVEYFFIVICKTNIYWSHTS